MCVRKKNFHVSCIVLDTNLIQMILDDRNEIVSFFYKNVFLISLVESARLKHSPVCGGSLIHFDLSILIGKAAK